MCSSFNFSTTQSQPFDFKKWPIRMGNSAVILVDDEPVLIGWIEDIEAQYAKDSHAAYVSGRDVTCDLVDCQMAAWHVEWANATVTQTVKELIAPFSSISITVDPSATTLASKRKGVLYVSPGENMVGAVNKIARWAHLFTMAGTKGDVVLTMVGSRVAAVPLVVSTPGIRGNIINGGLKCSDKERFSVYRTKGIGFDTEGTIRSKEYLWMNGTYYDPAVTRFRPYANTSPVNVNTEEIGWQTKSDAQYRAGNSRTYSYTVQGWREKEGGELWAPNTLVFVTDPWLGLNNEELLIESVDFTQSDQGTTTSMQLCSAYKYTEKIELDRIKTVFDIGIK